MEKEVEVKVEQVNQVDGLWILNLKQSGKMQPSTRHLPKRPKKFNFQILADWYEKKNQSSTPPP